MSKGSKRHVHKYYHADLLYGKLWACALPDCQHHMPVHYEGLLNGKDSICWQCNGRFKLNEQNMKIDRPICESCRLGITENEVDLPLSSAMMQRISKVNGE